MKINKLSVLVLLPLLTLASCDKNKIPTSNSSPIQTSTTAPQPSTPNSSVSPITTPDISTPSTTIPITSTPITSTTSTSGTSTSPIEPEDWSTPSGRNAIFKNTPVGTDGTYILGQVMKFEQYNYSYNHNIYLNDGPYAYQVLNVPLTEGVKIGDYYMLGGKKRESPNYGARIDYQEDAGAVKISEEELETYGLVPSEVKTVSSTSSVTTFPAIVNISNLVLKSRDNINPEGSFDKGSVIVKSDNKDVTIEVLGSLINGKELATIFSKTLLDTPISINNLILFSPTLARVASAEDIDLGEDGDELVVNSVLASLNINDIIENDLTLITSLLGATITWSSTDEEVISVKGIVNRPSYGSSDASVVLAASVNKGDVTKTKSFTITVPALTSPIQEGDLFIYVYMEGSGSNKIIGLKNGSPSDINLSNYTMNLYPNGATSANPSLKLPSKTLASGEIFYLYNSEASSTVLEKLDPDKSSSANAIANYNGDDAIGLLKNESIIDVVGVIGTKVNFPVGDGKTCKDSTLIRSSSLISGNTTFTASEWVVYDIDETPFLD